MEEFVVVVCKMAEGRFLRKASSSPPVLRVSDGVGVPEVELGAMVGEPVEEDCFSKISTLPFVLRDNVEEEP